MYRDGIEMRTEEGVNFVLSHGALGDAISSLPAIVWARKRHTLDIAMRIWCAPYQVDLFKHLLEGPGLTVHPLEDLKRHLHSGSPEFVGACVVNYTIKNTVTRNKHDMVEFAFATLLDRQTDDVVEKEYPWWAPLGDRVIDEDYVVIPVGATNDASTLHASVLAVIVEGVLERGLVPVLTGKRGKSGVVMLNNKTPMPLVIHDKVDDLPKDLLDRCVDLRDKTNLLELRSLCGHARAVLGIDGGTLHLAGTTEVPIVYGCTRVAPRHRGIVRHGEQNWNLIHVTPRDLACSGCQSNWTLMFGFDFSKCGYNDFACTKQLDGRDFLEALDILLTENP